MTRTSDTHPSPEQPSVYQWARDLIDSDDPRISGIAQHVLGQAGQQPELTLGKWAPLLHIGMCAVVIEPGTGPDRIIRMIAEVYGRRILGYDANGNYTVIDRENLIPLPGTQKLHGITRDDILGGDKEWYTSVRGIDRELGDAVWNLAQELPAAEEITDKGAAEKLLAAVEGVHDSNARRYVVLDELRRSKQEYLDRRRRMIDAARLAGIRVTIRGGKRRDQFEVIDLGEEASRVAEEARIRRERGKLDESDKKGDAGPSAEEPRSGGDVFYRIPSSVTGAAFWDIIAETNAAYRDLVVETEADYRDLINKLNLSRARREARRGGAGSGDARPERWTIS